jgi:hypothetical protein
MVPTVLDVLATASTAIRETSSRRRGRRLIFDSLASLPIALPVEQHDNDDEEDDDDGDEVDDDVNDDADDDNDDDDDEDTEVIISNHNNNTTNMAFDDSAAYEAASDEAGNDEVGRNDEADDDESADDECVDDDKAANNKAANDAGADKELANNDSADDEAAGDEAANDAGADEEADDEDKEAHDDDNEDDNDDDYKQEDTDADKTPLVATMSNVLATAATAIRETSSPLRGHGLIFDSLASLPRAPPVEQHDNDDKEEDDDGDKVDDDVNDDADDDNDDDDDEDTEVIISNHNHNNTNMAFDDSAAYEAASDEAGNDEVGNDEADDDESADDECVDDDKASNFKAANDAGADKELANNDSADDEAAGDEASNDAAADEEADDEDKEAHDGDNEDDNDDDYKEDMDADETPLVAKTSARNHIPTTKKQRRSSLLNLYTNALDPPKYNLLHKAQQPVAADAPGFREASEKIIIPSEMMLLYQHFLAKPKESFFISAMAHINIISKVCGLSMQEMIKMRGWVFLRKKSLKGAPYRYQTFSESVYATMMLGSNDETNPRNLIYRFDDVLVKMRQGYADLTSQFPEPIAVPSRKTSKKKGHEGEALTKYHRGISIPEKEMLAASNYSRKIRKFFEKYHLGVGAVHAIFSDSLSPDYDRLFSLCDGLFRCCTTETGYISLLHDALRVFCGVYSSSKDGVESKKRWIEHPSLFIDQIKLKFGKPGVPSLERYEQEVASKFNDLMNDNAKKVTGAFTVMDNAVLIRLRVQRFHQQKRLNSNKTNRVNKRKRQPVILSAEQHSAKKLSINTPVTSARKKDSPGFLNLLHTQAERKQLASSDPFSRRVGLLKFVSGGRNQENMTTNSALPPAGNLPLDVNNKMAINADPGPFITALHENLKAFGPVLVILPHQGDIDVVLVELSPLDVYYRKNLRLDSHSMTYLSSVPSFEEMRQRGYNFQFYSSEKDFVSDSFAILRGETNQIVGEVMDLLMPTSHSYSAHFKLLGHHGEFQERRDSGNKAGGEGQGYRVDLGACDHNFDGLNMNGLGPTPKTNGGVKCFDEITGIEEIDSSREDLRNYFGSLMDAIQLIVDKVRVQHGFKRIFDDYTRDESFAAQLRDILNAKYSRAEVSSNFATLMDGVDGCSFHKDAKNCPVPSYDWTCCAATTVQSESPGRLYRAVTNLNSRVACGRAMEGETKFAGFKIGLETEMERVNSSYKEIYGDGPEAPTAKTFTKVYLTEELSWGKEDVGEGHHLRCITAASAPSRDLFLSAAASAVYNLRQKKDGPSCHTMVGLLLVCMYMSSYQQFYTIMLSIKGDPMLLDRINTDLPSVYWDTSEKLFPKFWGGAKARFVPSGFDFKLLFVDDKTKFEVAVGELKELLKLVNTTLDCAVVTAKIKEMAESANLPYLHVFRLQLFIPLAALCGLVLPSHLFHADYIEPSEGVENGSYSALTTAGFARHRHSDTLLNICGQVGLPRRHSLGECLTCESHRRYKRFDLFIHGQDLFHLFLNDTGYSVQRKRFNSMEWEPATMISQTMLQSEDCG